MRNVGEGILYLGQEMNGIRIGKRTFISGVTSSELIVAVKCHVKKASEAVWGPKGKIWEKEPSAKSAKGRNKGNSGVSAGNLD